MKPFAIIAASTTMGGIGKNNQLPWHISADLKRFQKITSYAPEGKKNAVIMGRKTWESLPTRPLPKRINMIISSTITCNDVAPDKDVLVSPSLHNAIAELQQIANIHRIFVIGGAKVYEEAIVHPLCNQIYITHIMNENVDCDTKFPIDKMVSDYIVYDVSFIQKEDQWIYAFENYIRR